MVWFFTVVSVAVTSFTIWCGYTHQPRETSAINLLSMVLSFQLIRMYRKKKS